jgi:anti-sigma B factor antagonist
LNPQRVTEGGTTPGPTSGLRKDPVSGVRRDGAAVVVSLAGELDLYNAADVREALLAACADEPQRLVVDLADVTFIDSTALGVLIEARSRLENKRAFVLAAPGLETKRALEISGLDRHFTVHDSVASALAAEL